MSKEATTRGVKCACGQVFAFPEYHWPHCPMNPMNLSGAIKNEMAKKFTKPELASIAAHGPVNDQRIGKRGKRGRR
jgi:hypothetical protein